MCRLGRPEARDWTVQPREPRAGSAGCEAEARDSRRLEPQGSLHVCSGLHDLLACLTALHLPLPTARLLRPLLRCSHSSASALLHPENTSFHFRAPQLREDVRSIPRHRGGNQRESAEASDWMSANCEQHLAYQRSAFSATSTRSNSRMAGFASPFARTGEAMAAVTASRSWLARDVFLRAVNWVTSD